jgi:hypothetical protein
MTEYLRPWKVSTLLLGIAVLVVGAFYYRVPDWDVAISFIMAILAYLAAPWSFRIVLERRWRYLPAVLFVTWFTVDGCYWIYWHFKDPVALEMMRSANFPASLSLYGLCGIGWLYRGTLRELWSDLRRPFRQSGRALHAGNQRPTV